MAAPVRWGLAAACLVLLVLGAHAVALGVGRAAEPHFLQREVGNKLVGSIFGSNKPVYGTQCNIDVVETANTEQLHSILQALVQMTYFRLIRVNVNGPCRIEAFQRDGVDKLKEEADSPSPSKADQGAAAAAGAGAGQEDCGEVITDDSGAAEPACALKGVLDGSPFASFLSASAGSSSSSSSSSSPPPWSSSSSTFHSPLNDFLSEREAQVMQAASATEDEQQCAENLPEFWLDLCRDFEASATYNLQLNPEQWTGYNGSALWQAMYEENCFRDDDSSSSSAPMCFEERVMHRLLSGMHASTNIHISKFFYPPSKRKGRLEWAPNPARFMEQYGQMAPGGVGGRSQAAEHLENLHFTFLVVLRAVQKASNYLYYHDYRISGADWPQLDVAEGKVEEIKTQQLMRRLLDSGILASCAQVFSAFDEKLLFRDVAGGSKHNTLKKSFKQVFSNISSILNCVTCHKCRLHGKIQLMGLGAALKILLVPESYVEIALSRDELVALFNTLAKLSSSIAYARELAQLFWEGVENQQRNNEESDRQLLRHFQESRNATDDDARDLAAAVGELRKEQLPLVDDGQHQVDLAAAFVSDERAVMLGLDSVAAVAASHAPLTVADEDAVVDQLMDGEPGALALARTFARRGLHQNFARHVLRRFREQRACVGCARGGVAAMTQTGDAAASVSSPSSAAASSSASPAPARASSSTTGAVDADVVIVGGGLAGLTAAITIADAGFSVILLEKQGLLGGNSAWASSGVNAVDVTKVRAPACMRPWQGKNTACATDTNHDDAVLCWRQ
jgi:ERO1-like protein alpha